MSIKKILVSQPKPATDKSPYFDLAQKFGVEIVFRPFIKVEGLSAKEFRQSRINLSDFGSVLFTSKTAIDNYFRLCEESRFAIPDTMKYFCLTESIALYLQKYIVYRKRKIFFGLSGKMDDPQLAAAMAKHYKEKMLFPVSDVHTDKYQDVLDQTRITYEKAVMYRTVSNDFGPDEPFDYDVLLFFSPEGIKSLTKNFPDFSTRFPDVSIGVFGPAAAKAAEAAGYNVAIKAPTPECPSMTAALEHFLREQK